MSSINRSIETIITVQYHSELHNYIMPVYASMCARVCVNASKQVHNIQSVYTPIIRALNYLHEEKTTDK